MCRKLTYEEVKGTFEASGYTLLSKEYISNCTKLDYRCSEGHFGSMTYSSLQQGHSCLICSIKNKRLSYKDVKKMFESRGYVLLSKEYINSGTKLDYRCPRGHLGSMVYNHFQDGRKCPVCVGEDRRHFYEEIKVVFESRGYKLISSEYKDNKTKLEYVCPKGHLGSMTFSNFQQGRKCPVCSVDNIRLSYEEVKEAFDNRGYTLLSTEYVNSNIKLDYKCPKGHLGAMKYNSFQQGKSCPICSLNYSVSKVSQVWLDSLGVSNERGVSREVTLKIGENRFKADGFDPETNTVYEFLGTIWHGDPRVCKPLDINYVNKKTFGQLYQETFDRIKLIEEAGYRVIYIWESDFRSQNFSGGEKELIQHA